PDGIYQKGLARKGIRLSYGRVTDVMQTITASDAMTPPKQQVVPASLPASQLEAEFDKTDTHGLVVLDDDGKLFGIVSLQDLARQRANGGLDGKTVGDICTRDVITVTTDDPISDALSLLGQRDLGRLP